MGNVVTGEALRLLAASEQHIHSYVACQAALPAEVYDPVTAANYPINFTYADPDLPPPANSIPVSYGPTTPDIYPDWLTPNSNGASSKSRFYNENDFALAPNVWDFNEITKPDDTASNEQWGWAGSDINEDNPDQFFRGHSSTAQP